MVFSSVQAVLVAAYAVCPSIMNLLGIILIYAFLLLKVLVGVGCGFLFCFLKNNYKFGFPMIL